ncbi:MAG: sugar transferase, partial [Bacteroidetes bacterium]|nr:sugar transferase [Bacteroidota bacterium]
RNTLSWQDKFNLDIWYVDNRTLILDLKILWTTVFSVLKREGITQENHASMEPFRGNDI